MTTASAGCGAVALACGAVTRHMSLACNIGRSHRGVRDGRACPSRREAGALMLKRLFQRPRTASTNEPLVDGAPPATPRGVRIYAVGDVHGRIDLLLAMEELIETDRREHGPRDDVLIVHLGDLVDRGFESRKVLDHLVATADLGPPKALI